MSQSSADLLRQHSELLQNAWRFGLESATAMMGQKNATERSVRDTETVLNSATAVKGRVSLELEVAFSTGRGIDVRLTSLPGRQPWLRPGPAATTAELRHSTERLVRVSPKGDKYPRRGIGARAVGCYHGALLARVAHDVAFSDSGLRPISTAIR